MTKINDNKITKKDIIQCIKTVMDPEIPVNIYDLGLIYSIKIVKNNVVIEMTLTNPKLSCSWSNARKCWKIN